MKTEARIDAVGARLKRLGVDIVPIHHPPWVTELEARIGGELPADYRSLITRYRFPPFTIGPVDLFGNEGQLGYRDILRAPFTDPIIAAWMVRPDTFKSVGRATTPTTRLPFVWGGRSSNPDSAVVARFHHEPILLGDAGRAPDPMLGLLL